MVWEQPMRQGLMQRPALRLGGYQPPATVEPATTRPVAGPNGTTPSADSRAPLGTGRRSTPGRWPRGRRRTRTRTRSIRSTRMTPTQTGRCTAGRRGSRTGWAASRSTPALAARDIPTARTVVPFAIHSRRPPAAELVLIRISLNSVDHTNAAYTAS